METTRRRAARAAKRRRMRRFQKRAREKVPRARSARIIAVMRKPELAESEGAGAGEGVQGGC
jgi:hypothetical protein